HRFPRGRPLSVVWRRVSPDWSPAGIFGPVSGVAGPIGFGPVVGPPATLPGINVRDFGAFLQPKNAIERTRLRTISLQKFTRFMGFGGVVHCLARLRIISPNWAASSYPNSGEHP